MELKYKRVLLKISGEALSGENGHGISYEHVKDICLSIKELYDIGCEIAIVVGGGNFWRGKLNTNMERATADYIGMLATTMNALAINDGLLQLNCDSRVQTAIEMRQISELYIRNRTIKHLEKNRIVVFGCGTGNPYFSTDTAAALRAAEIKADVIIKATKVDGIYSSDPKIDKDATMYSEISYLDVLNK